MKRVLIAEDSRTQAEQIKMILEDAQFEVELTTNGKEAIESLRRRVAPDVALADMPPLPDIVLTDLEMPEMNGLELVEAIHKEFAWIPVILMTAHGSEEIAAKALSKGAASYVPKSFLEQDIVPTLERILSLTSENRHHHQSLECLTKSNMSFALRSDVQLIPPLLNYLDEMLKLLKICDVTEGMRVGVALHEAILNAIYHGNLEVSSSLRQEDETNYYALVNARALQGPYQYRRVHVDVTISPAEARYVIRDEGPGFDPSQLPDPTDPEHFEKIGGRGLLLIRTFMDEVQHNDKGNVITLVKRRGS